MIGDAIAGELAIEHTSVDTLPDQRRDAERFEEALGGVERLGAALTFRLWIVVPYDLISVGCIQEEGRHRRSILSRAAPPDDTLGHRISRQIQRKLKKLAPYKADGYTTVLLLESGDLSLMNQHKMLEATRTGVSGALPAGLDQLWYVEARRGLAAQFFDFTSGLVNNHKVLD